MAQFGQRKATARLSGLRTQEVALVDHAANLRKWIVVKGMTMTEAAEATKKDFEECVAQGNDPEDCAVAEEEGVELAQPPGAPAGETTAKAPEPPLPVDAPMPPADAPPADAPAAGGLALPGEVKQGLLDTLALLLDKMTTLAEMVNGATEQEGAAVPPELGQLLGETAMVFDGLVDQYAPGGEAPAAPAPDGSMPAEEKALTPVAQAAASVAKAAVAISTSKAGRKMAGSRLSMLKQAYEILSGLLKELMDENLPEQAAAAPGVPAPAPAPRPAAPAPVAAPAKAQQPAPAPAAKSQESETEKSLVEQKLDQLLTLVAKSGAPAAASPEAAKIAALEATVRKQAAQLAEVTKAGTPRAKTAEAETPPTSPAAPRVVWDSDLAESAVRRRDAATKTANGATK